MRMTLVLWLLLALAGWAQEEPWFLGLDGGVYRGLQRVGLGTGSSLAVAGHIPAGQTPYLVGQDGKLWSADAQGSWKPLDGLYQARKVVVGPAGILFTLGLDGGIYRVAPDGWQRVGGLGVGRDLAATEAGDLFVIGSDGRVWSYRKDWFPYNPLALGKRVAAGPDGTVYVVGTDSGIYRVGPEKVERLGLATGQGLAVSASGQLAIVGLDGGVYLWDNGNWKRLGLGTVREVTYPR